MVTMVFLVNQILQVLAIAVTAAAAARAGALQLHLQAGGVRLLPVVGHQADGLGLLPAVGCQAGGLVLDVQATHLDGLELLPPAHGSGSNSTAAVGSRSQPGHRI